MRRYRLFFDGWLCATLVIGAGIGIGKAQNAAPAPTATAARELVKLPAEIRELLEDRQIYLAEIDRIDSATGTVQIATPRKELVRRAESKWQKFLAWLDANNIPREWQKQGWTLRDGAFHPPAKSDAPAVEQPKKP